MSKRRVGRSNRYVRMAAAVLAMGVVTALIVYGVTRKKPPAKSQPIEARLELAAGEVLVDQDGEGEAAEQERAVSGMALRTGASVEAKKGARALVRLPDGSSSFMRGGTKLTLDGGSVTLAGGEYWLDVPEIERDPLVHRAGDVSVSAANAGLSLKSGKDGVTVYVARGMAIVSGKGGRVEVNAGEQTVVSGADAPKVTPVAFWDDWTGGMADHAALAGMLGPGTGTIYGVDSGAPGGAAAQPLQIKRQTVRAVIRDGLSETTVDQTFFNPSPRPVEGWYWFVIPEGASVAGFAVETNGVLVEGEFIEKREAAAKYTQAKSSGHAPAILEWVDGRSYRARIFPVPASGMRRVVLRYLELKPVVDDTISYVYPMGRGTPARIGEFSLSAELGDDGRKMKIATLDDARVEDGGTSVTMRRSGYTPRADFQLEAKLSKSRPTLSVSRFETGGDGADYLMARYTPDADWSAVKEPRADVVVVVDTSADGDETVRQLKATAAEAILRALSDDDRFALMSLDVRAKMLHPDKEMAKADDANISKALEKLSDHSSGGATDMAALFDEALGRVHGAEQPAVVYVGDGIATSGEMTGEQLIERLRRALSTSRSRLFTVAVGAGADEPLLGELARAGGGDTFRVDAPGKATAQALELVAAVKVPTITDFELDLGAGLDEPFSSVSGKLPRGSDMVLLARTHHDLPKKAVVRGRLGGEAFEKEVEISKEKGIVTALVPKLWAAAYVRRLLGAAAGPDAERGRIVALGTEYGLVTPFTSILALENEAAYSRMGIQRSRSPLRGVKLGALDATGERNVAAMVNPFDAPRVTFGCLSAGDEEAAPAATEPMPVAPGVRGGPAARNDSLATDKPAEVAAQATAEANTPSSPRVQAPAAVDEEEAAEPADDVPPARAPARPMLARKAKGSGFGGGGKASPMKSPAPDMKKLARDALEKARSGKRGREDLAGKDDESIDGDAGGERERDRRKQEAKPVQLALSTCSDVARRPLAQRLLMWRKRLRTAKDVGALIARYQAARRACELDDWRAEREFLRLMQRQVSSEAGARTVLMTLASRPEVQRFVAQLILRRVVDPRVVAAVERVLFGSAVDWNAVDLKLTEIQEPAARIDELRTVMARSPNDPNGQIRLVEQLALDDRGSEALTLGRRLRDRGLLTLRMARKLGDVLARQKLDEEAVRTYSEIVEFDPSSLASRSLLGDIYLGHGWYEPAYRQYKTVTDAAPDNALGWLRLAAAAAGSGRIDEALRLERKVATAQGRPGPNDPRRWARLWSAARLARLIAEPPKGDKAPSRASVERKLKELGLFASGAGTLVVLTWEDLSDNVLLVTRVDEQAAALGEQTDAAPAGLSAALLSAADRGRAQLVARLRSVPRQDPIALVLHEITWDGKKFTVKMKRHELAAGETLVEL